MKELSYETILEDAGFLGKADLAKIVEAYEKGRLNNYITVHPTKDSVYFANAKPPFFFDRTERKAAEILCNGQREWLPCISLNMVLCDIAKKDPSMIYPSTLYQSASWLSKQLGNATDSKKIFRVDVEIDMITYQFVGGLFIGCMTPTGSNVIYSGENLEI